VDFLLSIAVFSYLLLSSVDILLSFRGIFSNFLLSFVDILLSFVRSPLLPDNQRYISEKGTGCVFVRTSQRLFCPLMAGILIPQFKNYEKA